MALEEFTEYKSREFCNDVRCSVQMELNENKDMPEEYEKIRETCRTSCRYTARQFHHWLVEKGYIILASSKLKNNEKTVLANLDKELVDWVDQQIKNGKFCDRSQLIESAVAEYKKEHDK